MPPPKRLLAIMLLIFLPVLQQAAGEVGSAVLPKRAPVSAPATTRQTDLKTADRECCVGPGLTWERCSTARGCAEPRFCLKLGKTDLCEYGLDICHCRPLVLISCSHESQCPFGEICAERLGESAYCYEKHVVIEDGSFTIINTDCCTPPTYPPTYPPTTTKTTTRMTTRLTTQTTHRTSHTTKYTTEQTTKYTTAYPPKTSAPPKPTPSRPATGIPPTPRTSRQPEPSPEVQRPSEKPSASPIPLTIVPKPSRQPPVTSGQPSPSPTGGLTGDECTPTRGCKSYRKCARRGEHSPCTDCSGVCIYAQVCRCNEECEEAGEVCAGAHGKSYCFSRKLVSTLDWVVTYPCNSQGLSCTTCSDDAQCLDGRTCVRGRGGGEDCGRVEEEGGRCEVGDTDCHCSVKTNVCDCDHDCNNAEVCCETAYGKQCVSKGVVDGSSYLRERYVQCQDVLQPPTDSLYVMSEQYPPRSDGRFVAPEPLSEGGDGEDGTGGQEGTEGTDGTDGTNTGTESEVCIDARALRHVGRHELVYAQHRLSEVVCDRFDSCATEGHVVVYKGAAMLMRSYCAVVGCVTRVLEVNSPKYRRRLSVPSNTAGLHFTALAARFATKGEELVLKAVIRAGF